MELGTGSFSPATHKISIIEVRDPRTKTDWFWTKRIDPVLGSLIEVTVLEVCWTNMTLYLGVLINESHKWDLGLAVFDIFRSFGEYYRYRTIEYFGESYFDDPFVGDVSFFASFHLMIIEISIFCVL